MLRDFGYYDLFNPEDAGNLDLNTDFMTEHNRKALSGS